MQSVCLVFLHHGGVVVPVHVQTFNLQAQDFTAICIKVDHWDCWELWTKTKSSRGTICLNPSKATDDTELITDRNSPDPIRSLWSRLSPWLREELGVRGWLVGWRLFHVTDWSVKFWPVEGILQECGEDTDKISSELFVWTLKNNSRTSEVQHLRLRERGNTFLL